MTGTRYDVVAIGNAIVDILASADDAFLVARSLPKGRMVLIDEAQADALYDQMGPAVEASGGSAANTVAGLASLGSSAAFIGKVADDTLGTVFRHDITAIGVHYDTPPAVDGPATARCMVLITPDADRTMSTYLGACTRLTPADIDESIIVDSKVLYVEGYLWDEPEAKDAIMQAICAAKEAGRQVALSLSDSLCVRRHHEEFQELVAGFVDILFANEAEICALFDAPFEQAVQAIRGTVAIAALTRGADGCQVVTDKEILTVPIRTSVTVVDTTGAGDLFAAGFLHGLTQGQSLLDCARLGNLCAAEVISHVGPRPAVSLKTLVLEAMAV